MTQRVNVVLTALFVAVTGVGVVVFDDLWRGVVVVVDLALFAVGVVTFILGYFAAVARSRTEEISVVGAFLLAGEVAPRSIRRVMWGCLGTQVVVGIAGAIARGTTDGQPGSVLAFGVLVPMLGIGLNGWWAGRHGTFPPRVDRK